MRELPHMELALHPQIPWKLHLPQAKTKHPLRSVIRTEVEVEDELQVMKLIDKKGRHIRARQQKRSQRRV